MTTPKKPRATENLNVWIRSALVDALRVFVASVRPRTTKTAVVEEALEQFLRDKGFLEASEPEPPE